MRPAAHLLSLRPPKKVSKERRPHVSDPALHCAALRYVPGKPAMTLAAAARQNSLRAARSVRTTAASQITMQAHAALCLPAAVTALAGAASRGGRAGPSLRSAPNGLCCARLCMWEGSSASCFARRDCGHARRDAPRTACGRWRECSSGNACGGQQAVGDGRAAARMRLGCDMPHVAYSVQQGSGLCSGRRRWCTKTAVFAHP